MVKHTITYLADHPAIIPVLATWFRAQWPNYYAHRTQEEVESAFYAEANRDKLPVRLVAFTNGELAGTIVLRERALRSLPDSSPGLGGLFVPETHRGHGIGTELVRAGMNTARAQGYSVVYAGTAVAGAIFERLGWDVVKVVEHDDEQLELYRCEL